MPKKYIRPKKKTFLIELEKHHEEMIHKFKVKALQEKKSMKDKFLEFVAHYVKDC